MTRCLLKLSLVMVAAFAVFNVAARAVGTLQPPNPALAGFTEGCEGKPQPCWYGIVPGVTKKETAFFILKSHGYIDERDYIVNPDRLKFCTPNFSWNERGIVNRVGMGCPNFYAGELFAIVGLPERITIGGDGERFLYFAHNVSATVFRPESTNIVFLNDIIVIMGFHSESPQPPANATFQWHGFKTLDEYRQLEPGVTEKWFCCG